MIDGRDDAGSCAVCEFVADAERSFVRWLAIESHGEATVRAGLRAGLGLCPPHARRLVDDVGDGNVLLVVAGEALYGARSALAGESRPGACLACDAAAQATEHGAALVRGRLCDIDAAGRREPAPRLCWEHFRIIAADLAPAGLLTLARHAATAGADVGAAWPLGRDDDAPRRARWRRLLPDGAPHQSTVAALCAALALEACPVCRAVALADRRYLEWCARRARDGDPALATDAARLCDAHLADLAQVDPGAGAVAVAAARAARLADLARLLEHVEPTTTLARGGRRAAAEMVATALEPVLAPTRCPACHVRAGTHDSALKLIGATRWLATVHESYERGWGLCVRHALAVSPERSDPALRRHADARVRLLVWEVEEATRKRDWAYRHEPAGPETGAPLRALAHLDGRVFEGGPPESAS